MTGAAAMEPVRSRVVLEIERRALDVLPSERSAHGDAKVLPRDFAGVEPLQAEPRNTSGAIARRDFHSAKTVAAKAGRMKSAQQICFANRGIPQRTAAAGVVGLDG